MDAQDILEGVDAVRPEEATAFLHAAYPEGPWVFWAKAPDLNQMWCSPAFYPGDEVQVEDWLYRHGRKNLYFHVNPYPNVRRDERGALVKAKKTDITQVTFLHVDIDPTPPPPDASDAEKLAHLRMERERIRSLLTKAEPSFVIDSGGGYQGLFRPEQPIELDRTEDTADTIAAYNHALAMDLGGDVSARDVSRVLRLPGTTNWPDKKKREKGRIVTPARMVTSSERTYPLSHFRRHENKVAMTLQPERSQQQRDQQRPTENDPVLVTSLDPKLVAIIQAGRDLQNPSRWPSDSETVFYVACQLIRCGMDEAAVASILANESYGISAHVMRQGRPGEYALRQARRARDAVGLEPLTLSAANPRLSAEKYVALVRPDLISANGEYLDYDGASYQEVEEQTIKAEIYTLLDRAIEPPDDKGRSKPLLSNKKKVADVLDALTSRVHRPRHEFEPPCWLNGEGPPANEMLSFPNGILHVPSGELLPASRHFFTRNALEFPYQPAAPVPSLWHEILGQYWETDPASIGLLQEIMGHLIGPSNNLHKIPVIIGPTRSGKGFLASTISKLVGVRNVCGPSINGLATPFGLESLIGKQVAVVGDMRIGRRSDAASIAENLLRISGNDLVTIDRKYRPAWIGRLPTRFIILSNEMPSLADASGALAKRFVPLIMTKSFFGKEDPSLQEKLIPELPSILNWSIDGWRRLNERKRFELPAASNDALASLLTLGSPVTTFVDEECDLFPEGEVAKAALYAAWQAHCGRTGQYPGTIHTFGRDLLAAFAGQVRVGKPRRGGGRLPIYMGIRLNAQPPEELPF